MAGMEDISSNRISLVRKSKGVTQQELADRLGVHFVTVSKLERGVMQLTAKWIMRLADALDVQPGEIWSPPASLDLVDIGGRIEQGFSVDWFKALEQHQILTEDADDEASAWLLVGDNSLAPFFFEGDLLRFTSFTKEEAMPHMIGRLCFLTLADRRQMLAIPEKYVGGNILDVRTLSGIRMNDLPVEIFHVFSGAKIKMRLNSDKARLADTAKSS